MFLGPLALFLEPLILLILGILEISLTCDKQLIILMVVLNIIPITILIIVLIINTHIIIFHDSVLRFHQWAGSLQMQSETVCAGKCP